MPAIGFQQRQVDVGRTFRRAGFAREAVAQRRFHFPGAQRIALEAAQLQRRADRVGPAARGHDFLARGDKRRAHGRRLLETAAAAVALLEIAHERTVLGRERQPRLERQFQRRARAQPQICVNPVTVVGNDFPGIEQLVRVEGFLDLPHQQKHLFADLLLEKFRSRNAHAVLTGERSVELPHQRGNFPGNLAELFQVRGRVQVQHGPHVQQTGPGMAVIRGLQSQFPDQLLQPVVISRQILRAHRRVFNARHRLRVARPSRQQRKPRLAQRPHMIDLGERLHDFLPPAKGHPFHRGEPVLDLAVELNDQHRLARLRVQIEQVTGDFEFPLAFGLIEQHAINVFDRGRLQAQQFRRRLQGLGRRIEKNQARARRDPAHSPASA